MNLQRYVVELGVGTDLHGQDVTKAAVKAVRDAISRSSLCGLREVLHLSDLNDMVVLSSSIFDEEGLASGT